MVSVITVESVSLLVSCGRNIFRCETSNIYILPVEFTAVCPQVEHHKQRARQARTPRRSTPLGSRKRKRMTVTHQGAGDYSHLQSSSSSAFNATSSATGAVEISEVDPAGQFIKIHNTSDKVRLLEGCCCNIIWVTI